jgi:hypothetical protein
MVNLNRNVNWLNYPGVWTWYIGCIVLAWFLASAWLDDIGLAWTYVHLVHGIATYYLLHWIKGTPFPEDQGKYEALTFWEQIDNGEYSTRNRKLFTAVPVILFLLATHGTDFRKQPLGLNLGTVVVLLVAKLPSMHKVRILGINRY